MGTVMRYITTLIIQLAPAAAVAATAMSSPQAVTVSVDSDLLVLIKGAIWVGSIFIALFAFIGVAFFGWDVRKARASLADAQHETRELMKELHADFAEMKALKDKLEQLGAQLEEGGVDESKEPPLERAAQRNPIDLIREVIKTSNYEWTTIGRVIKRTALNREQVLEEVRKAPDIRISNGRKTQDFIFKSNE